MSLTNNQVFPGDVKITDDLRVNSSTLSINADNNRVGVNKESPGVELDVGGNTYVTSDLTVGTGTDSFHVDTTNGRVGIGTTQPSVDFEAFPDVGSQWAIIGKARLGRSTRYPAFSHIDMTDGDWYAVLQDNNTGDTYFNCKSSQRLYFCKLNGALGAFYNGNLGIGQMTPTIKLHLGTGYLRQNLPYISVDKPEDGDSNQDLVDSYEYTVRFANTLCSNRLSLNNNSVTIPTGCKGWYRLHAEVAIMTQSSESRKGRLNVYNRGTEIVSNENQITHISGATYNHSAVTQIAELDVGDVIDCRVTLPSINTFYLHHPNNNFSMYMLCAT
jgi:hypothetical protein